MAYLKKKREVYPKLIKMIPSKTNNYIKTSNIEHRGILSITPFTLLTDDKSKDIKEEIWRIKRNQN